MMSWEEFSEQVRRTGYYRTPVPLQRSLLDRALGRFDWWYHLLISQRVWSCGEVARKGRLDDTGWARKCLEVIHCVERCGGAVEVEMPESARACSPCVYIGNHMSVLETIILPCILIPLGHPTFVVKEDLLHYPALCHTLRVVNPIAVSRDNARDDLKRVLVQGKLSLEAGHSVVVFPQSTRNPVFDPAVFNSLGVKLAARSGVPVVPLALKTDFSGIGPFIKEFGRIDRSKTVHFKFGDPLDAVRDPKAAQAALVDFISRSLRQWGGTVLEPDRDERIEDVS
jgi:1-acyl-sn-glycerol-3-phosphate acyltransferase